MKNKGKWFSVAEALDNENVSLYEQKNAFGFLRKIEEHHPPTAQHSVRVGFLTRDFARIHGLDTGIAFVGGLLHDVGKIKIPRSVLDKEGHLTSEEWTRIQEHPLYSYALLDGFFPAQVAYMGRDHHRHPKAGEMSYPEPAGPMRFNDYSALCAAADVLDAITNRNNARGKPATTIEDIFERFEQHRPHQLPFILPYLEETRPHELIPSYRAA